MAKSIQQIINDIGDLGSPPDIYTRVETILNDESKSLNDVATIVESDPTLATKIIAQSNSPVYKIDSEVDNIERALTILGAKQLREVVLSTSVVSYFDEIPSNLIKEEDFWQHSITCAVVARKLASEVGQKEVEKYYLMGLLHDIGRLILFSKDSKSAIEILKKAKEESRLLTDVEEEILGFNHAELGGALLEKWSLPQAQIEAVSYHHAPSQAPNEAIAASVTHLADIVANYMQRGSSGERFMPKLDPIAWDILGIDEDILPDILEELKEELGD